MELLTCSNACSVVKEHNLELGKHQLNSLRQLKMKSDMLDSSIHSYTETKAVLQTAFYISSVYWFGGNLERSM